MRRRQPESMEGVLGAWEDMGTCLTYIGESLGFVLIFRVGPRTNRLVGGNGSGEKRGQTGCGTETN
jgi:hypothetical protein